MSKLVISGSNAFNVEALEWKAKWEQKGYIVTKYPVLLSQLDAAEYAAVFTNFMAALEQANALFVLNLDKNGIKGYIGAATFAEMVYANTLNQINNKKIAIILLQMPSNKVASYSELKLWLELGWMTILEN